MLNIRISAVREEKKRIVLVTKDGIQDDAWNSLKAEGKLLADSDNRTFVYLLENNDGFHYLRLPKEQWGSVFAITNNSKPVLCERVDNEHNPLELVMFREELDMLLENIKGNMNYGKGFVEEVEEVFELKK